MPAGVWRAEDARRSSSMRCAPQPLGAKGSSWWSGFPAQLAQILGGELTPPSTVGVQSCKGVQPPSTDSGRRSFARRDSELLLKCWSSPTESREISDYRWYGAS